MSKNEFVEALAHVGYDDDGKRLGYMIADGPHEGEFYYQDPDDDHASVRPGKLVRVRFLPADQFAKEVG